MKIQIVKKYKYPVVKHTTMISAGKEVPAVIVWNSDEGGISTLNLEYYKLKNVDNPSNKLKEKLFHSICRTIGTTSEGIYLMKQYGLLNF